MSDQVSINNCISDPVPQPVNEWNIHAVKHSKVTNLSECEATPAMLQHDVCYFMTQQECALAVTWQAKEEVRIYININTVSRAGWYSVSPDKLMLYSEMPIGSGLCSERQHCRRKLHRV